jgi:hypothetical protein
VSDWAWHRNPFVGTQPFRGLIVLNMMLLNNWDMKTTNNKIYDLTKPDQGTQRWYIVRDLGASLGRHRWFPWGTRNDVEGFERQQFIKGVEQGRVTFHYPGRHGELLRDITVADVTWACDLLSRLTPQQLDDAFRAAAYPATVRTRFVSRLRAKVQEGLALARTAGITPEGSQGKR